MISADVFSKTINRICAGNIPTRMAVAVSGGSDSMCLCLLLNAWAKENRVQFVALTVDHLLRQDSSAEAQAVHGWLSGLGIEHHILPWKKEHYPKNIQASARKARYQLLTDWCKARDISCLGVAHNAQDQYETILQRLAHHSGPLGLAGIAERSVIGGVQILRPLLGCTRQEIIQTLQHFKQDWLEDPSNQNLQFTRIQIRQNYKKYESVGLDASKVLQFQKRMLAYKQDIQYKASLFLKKYVAVYDAGYVDFSLQALVELPYEIKSYVLNQLLQQVSGKDYAPGRESLHEAVEKIGSNHAYACHGCRLLPLKNRFLISREFQNIGAPAYFNISGVAIWDNRFEIQIADLQNMENLRIEALGRYWLEFKENPKMIALPSAVRPTLPSVWQKERLLSVPFLDYYDNLQVATVFKPLIHRP